MDFLALDALAAKLMHGRKLTGNGKLALFTIMASVYPQV